MSVDRPVTREHGNAYNLFILVLTLFSLTVMGLLLLPLDPESKQLLQVYDNVICLIFLGDFAFSLSRSHPRRRYLVDEAGSTSSGRYRPSASSSSRPSSGPAPPQPARAGHPAATGNNRAGWSGT